jgi:hypothetical protein
LRERWREIREIIRAREGQDGPLFSRRPRDRDTYEAPEPLCAWYCPIHYFGHGWGIYIRERCIFHVALDIAAHVDWATVKALGLRPAEIVRQLLRSAFYIFFLHEQFHHKVESLGFRLLVTTGSDRYRPYKTKVYRPNFLKATCLEESLANAESYRRLNEQRYKKRHAPPNAGGSARVPRPVDPSTAARLRTGHELRGRGRLSKGPLHPPVAGPRRSADSDNPGRALVGRTGRHHVADEH